MKFPLMTALTALAMFGVLAGSAARADDDGKTKAEFIKRLFAGDVVKGKKSYACFVRRYDAAHLARHPQQKVAALKLLVTAEIDEETQQPLHAFRMGVKFRDKPDNFDTGGSCGHADVSETPSGQPRLGCGVDCDGGGLSIELSADNKSTVVRLERIALWNNSKPDDDERPSLEAGADDAVFRLDRAALALCKSLMPDKDELAALNLK